MAHHDSTPGDIIPHGRRRGHIETRDVLAVFAGLLVLLAVEVALVKTPGIAAGTLTPGPAARWRRPRRSSSASSSCT